MNVASLAASLRLPHRWAQWQLVRDLTPFLRVQFLHAGVASGVLKALRTPATREELVQRLDVQRPELLELLLELGVTLKELSRSNGRYRIRGSRSHALVGDASDPLAAMIEEMVTYHSSVYTQLADRLRGGSLGNYLEEYGVLITRSSRAMEPFVAQFARTVARTGAPMRLLEIGCGSGVYLRRAAEANPYTSGVAIDLQDEVVARAKANLAEWGISERFSVLVADVRHPPAEVTGPFDLITLYNNVYYFREEERPSLFEMLRSWLNPAGKLALVSLMQGKSVLSLDLNLALRSTVGCTALPKLDELTSQLRATGFARVETVKLMPLDPLYGVVAESS